MMSIKGKTKINKGAPSGLIVSLIFHAAAFFIAGLFVVFRVMNPPEPAFEVPPPIERPKMKLKKPKVKVRKSSQPKPSSRIVAKVKTREMPEIQLPDLVGTGEGLLGGTGQGGQFMDIPDIKSVTLLGSSESTGIDLVGTYYDMKRTSSGNSRTILKDAYLAEVNKFITEGWNPGRLSKYYRMPNKLYLTALVVPVVPSNFAPVAFGDHDAAEGRYWLVHYKGKLTSKRDITFRFWAAGDYILVVRVNGKIVVASVWDGRDGQYNNLVKVVGGKWIPRATDHRRYIFGHDALASVGDWITFKAGEMQDVEILVSDDGGLACAYLAVEEQGVDYPVGVQGGPILPAFRTAKLNHDMLDAIYAFLPEDEMICLTNGPVFNDL